MGRGDFEHGAAGGGAESRNERGAAGGERRKDAFFAGAQKLATVEALDDFVRRAEPGDEFTYCEAPEPIRGETWARVGELVRMELVRSHQLRRAGGGFRFFVVRSKRRLTAEQTPCERALADPATQTIYALLKRTANLGADCPSDAELARHAGLSTRAQAQQRFQKLIAVGLIESIVAHENGVPKRVVTIREGRFAGSAGARQTALPPKWRAAQQVMLRECGEGEGASVAGPSNPTVAGSPARGTYRRGRGGAL